VKQLRKSYHRVVMITGDHPLTACQVATSVAMADRPFLMLEVLVPADDQHGNKPTLQWKSQDEAGSVYPFEDADVQAMAQKYSLCVSGPALALLTEAQFGVMSPLITVFARTSPQQKEQIICAFNMHSHTMMVGDGTNDVGALKASHIGISLLSAAPPPLYATAGAGGQLASQRARMQQHMDYGDGGVPLVRLGDASIASPFTYKGDSVKCSLVVLRCGRATLATVIMMYKILGLNSVLSAFAMSVLTLDGVKLGDGQTTAESLFVSMCFFLVSRSTPSKNLAKQLPTSSVFHWSVLLALFFQLVTHLAVLFYGWQCANSLRPRDWKRDLEGEFDPNLTNTVVFILMSAMHASSFLSNYEGHPHMTPLTQNKPLLYALICFITMIVALANESVPELNDSLSLVLSPTDEFRKKLVGLVIADVCISFGLSQAVGIVASQMRGRAAEKRAQRLGLGM